MSPPYVLTLPFDKEVDILYIQQPTRMYVVIYNWNNWIVTFYLS